jgi:hypothetical protein
VGNDVIDGWVVPRILVAERNQDAFHALSDPLPDPLCRVDLGLPLLGQPSFEPEPGRDDGR